MLLANAMYTLGLFSLFFHYFFVVCVCVCVLGDQYLMGFRLSGSPPCVSILVLYVILIDYGK